MSSVPTGNAVLPARSGGYAPAQSDLRWAAGSLPAPESLARWPLVDIAVLTGAWLSIFVSTILYTGYGALAAFSVFAALAILRRSENGLVLLMMIRFSSVLGMTALPIFKILFPIVLFRAMFDGRFQEAVRHLFRPATLLAMLFTILTFLSLVITPNRSLGLRNAMDYLEALMFVLAVLVLADRLDSVGLILKAAAVLAAASLIVGLIQYTYRDAVWLTRVAELRETYTLGGVHYQGSLQNIHKDINRSRLLPLTIAPNYWGMSLMFPLGVAIGLLGASRTNLNKAFWGVASGMILIAILGTMSRGSYVAAAFLGLVLLARMRGRGTLPLILFGLLLVILLSSWGVLAERVVGMRENLEQEGGSGRFGLWLQTLRYWLRSILWGHGIGSVLHAIGMVTHNTYFQILAELGLLGFVVYVWILVLAFRGLVRASRAARVAGDRRGRWLFEGCLAGLAGMSAGIGTVSVMDAKFVWFAVFGCLILSTQYRHALYEQTDLAYGYGDGALA